MGEITSRVKVTLTFVIDIPTYVDQEPLENQRERLEDAAIDEFAARYAQTPLHQLFQEIPHDITSDAERNGIWRVICMEEVA